MPISRAVRRPLFAAALLALTACAPAGDDPAPEATAPAGETTADEVDGTDPDGDGFPVTVTTDTGEVTLDAPPQAIVSLSPSSTEILYAIGAGDQVVAVDRFSDHPDGTPTTDLTGFDPNVEAVADLGPDLVVASGDRNELVDGLGALSVPVLIAPSAQGLDDVTEQILTLGQLTGNRDAAEQLAGDLTASLEALAAQAPAEAEGLTYYHELSDGYFTATSDTFIGELYGLLGLTNIADAAPEAGDAGGFPQLAPEFVVEADPDLIFLAHEADVSDRPGWDGLTAVTEGHVIDLDTDVASRWGPRIVEQVEAALDAVLARVEAADAA